MTVEQRFLLFWLVAMSSFSTSYGIEPEKPLSLQIKNLTHWKNSAEAPAIQQSLGAILRSDRNDPTTSLEYVSIFKKPFLLLTVEPNALGGFFAVVVFKDYPKAFRLWIYEIDRHLYQIREAIKLSVTLNKEIMNELDDKRITRFWLAPHPYRHDLKTKIGED
jgi:hypothetical protein